MKKPLTLLSALALLALPVFADVGTQNTSCTNQIVASATNSASTGGMGNVIKIDGSDSVGITIKFSGSAAGTGNIAYRFVRSPDGVTFENSATPTLSVSNALAGATSVTNFYAVPADTIRGVHSIKLLNMQNWDASANATNLSITVSTKNSRTGR